MLRAVGYPESTGLATAAARLAAAPLTASDLREFLRLGRPPVDAIGRSPACVWRPLAHGLSVAELMSQALLAASGAFLLAAEMERDPARADTLLGRLITDGMWTLDADGTHTLRRPPLAERYPRCPRCGRPQWNADATCPSCAQWQSPPMPPDLQEMARLLDALDTTVFESAPAAAPAEPCCPRCGASNRAQAHYCAACGEALEVARPCPACGATIKPDARFCGACGTALSST